MNKLILLTVAAILIACLSFGQESYSVPDSTENNQQLDSMLVYFYSDGGIVKSEKHVYGYDETGTKILDTYYKWDSVLNDWIKWDKTEFSYDEAGNLTVIISYYRDYISKDLKAGQKVENSYDPALCGYYKF